MSPHYFLLQTLKCSEYSWNTQRSILMKETGLLDWGYWFCMQKIFFFFKDSYIYLYSTVLIESQHEKGPFRLSGSIFCSRQESQLKQMAVEVLLKPLQERGAHYL